MIPRHQAILVTILLLASLIMGGILFHMRDRAHQRMLQGQDAAPTEAPQVTAPEQATLLVANDDDNSLRTQLRSLPLPSDPGAKGRAVLGKLLDLYASPESTHPVPGGASSHRAGLPVTPAGTRRSTRERQRDRRSTGCN